MNFSVDGVIVYRDTLGNVHQQRFSILTTREGAKDLIQHECLKKLFGASKIEYVSMRFSRIVESYDVDDNTSIRLSTPIAEHEYGNRHKYTELLDNDEPIEYVYLPNNEDEAEQ
jgi:hypothetical protein